MPGFTKVVVASSITSPVSVFFDFPVSREKVGVILYANVKAIDFEFFDILESAYVKSNKGGCLSANHLLKYVTNSSEGTTIVLTERALDRRILYLSGEGVSISLCSPDAGVYGERLIAKILYIVAVLQCQYSGLLTDVDDVHLDESGLKTLLSLIPSPDVEEYIQPTLGRIDYNPVPEPVHALITHGIRDHAHWAESAHRVLYSKNIGVSILRYGWIDIIKFSFKLSLRRNYAITLLSRLNSVIYENKHKNISIIVHSFGSIVLAAALDLAEKTNIRINIDAIILNGSILPSDYDWRIFTRPGKEYGVTIRRVLNVCGQKDYWPVIANAFIRGAGYSGTFFFSDNYINNIVNIRIPGAGHSDILSIEYADEVWGRYLLDREFTPPANAGLKPDKKVGLLHYLLLLKWVFLVFFVVIIIFFML